MKSEKKRYIRNWLLLSVGILTAIYFAGLFYELRGYTQGRMDSGVDQYGSALVYLQTIINDHPDLVKNKKVILLTKHAIAVYEIYKKEYEKKNSNILIRKMKEVGKNKFIHFEKIKEELQKLLSEK